MFKFFDYCLTAAALHHFLDILEDYIRGYGWHVASQKKPNELLNKAFELNVPWQLLR